MPFKSKKQMKACFATKGFRGKINCREWAHETNMKSLPKSKLRGGCLECGGEMRKFQGGGQYSVPRREDYPDQRSYENALEEYYNGPSVNTRTRTLQMQSTTGQPVQQFGDQPNYNWTRTGQVPGNPNLPVDPALTTQIQESGDVNQFDVDPIRQKRNGNWVIKPDKQKVDPYFAIRGAVTGLSWLSGMAERKRQNQYMYNQLSTLGQRGTVPYQDYQPNPFSMYARFGGSLRKYQDGGKKKSPSVYRVQSPQPQFTPNYNFSSIADKYGTGYGGTDTTMYDIHFESMLNQEPNALLRRYKYEKYGLPTVGPNGGETDMKIYSADRSTQNAYEDALRQRAQAAYNMYSTSPVSRKPMQRGGNVYTSQAQIDRANEMARGILERRGDPNAANAIVARDVGNPVIKFTGDIPPPVTTPLATSLPFGVTPRDVELTSEGYGYYHPQQGTFVKVNPQSIFPAKATVPLSSMAKLKYGGKNRKKVKYA